MGIHICVIYLRIRSNSRGSPNNQIALYLPKPQSSITCLHDFFHQNVYHFLIHRALLSEIIFFNFSCRLNVITLEHTPMSCWTTLENSIIPTGLVLVVASHPPRTMLKEGEVCFKDYDDTAMMLFLLDIFLIFTTLVLPDIHFNICH